MSAPLGLPAYPSFDCASPGRAVRWQKWVSRLKNLYVGYGIESDERQKALLLTFAGDELNDIVDTFTVEEVTPTENESKFQKLCDAISNHFSPQSNREYQRYVFRHTVQSTDNIDEFYAELKQLSITCQFHDPDAEIKSQLISGCKSQKTREKGLSSQDISLADLLSYARTLQLTTAQAMQMSRPEVNAIQSRPKSDYQNQNPFSRTKFTTPRHQSCNRCNNCGGEWPHNGGQNNCPARGKTCRSCKKLHHFASVCKSTATNYQRSTPSYPLGQEAQRSQVHVINETDFEPISNTVSHVHGCESSCDDTEYIFTANKDISLPHFLVTVGEGKFRFLADSGATVNLVSKGDFDRIEPKPNLQPSSKKISAYGSSSQISVLGVFNATLQHGNASTEAPIYVVHHNERPILGWQTCRDLKLIDTFDNNQVNHVSSNQDPLIREYSDLFTGLGCLHKTKVKLHIDQHVQPVAQHYRRVPFHVRKDIENQLQKDEELGVIEKATGPTPWVSPVVVVPKPKQPGKVRVCVDMRSANTAIKREHHATPTLDELKTELSGAKFFSKLDLNQGYNQIELDESSRYITTFATHKGLYRYRRLFFGVNSASEIFQEQIRQALTGLKGVVNISDDILCYGCSQQEHDTNLRALFQRLREKGLTIHAEKCKFNQKSIEFLGHNFSASGITPSREKIKAILELPTPTNASEMRSLLGMVNFCGAHHIPQYASITHDLRLLTKKNAPWEWTEKHIMAFNALRKALSDAITLAYFDANKQTDIYTDGSPIGISAVLTQEGRIVQFASRPLTPTEQRYSQTERESLAIVWACEYFHVYIFGSKFNIHTDHKPLTVIFNNPKSKPSPRIERWLLRMLPYECIVCYRPGFDNPADFLSRHPIEHHPSKREQTIAEEYVNYLTHASIPKTMTIEEVAQETSQDPTLLTVINALRTNKWHDEGKETDQRLFHTLYLCRSELAVADNLPIILKGHQIVLPQSLHDRVIDIAHSGHQGIIKTLSLLREKIWIPNMQNRVENAVNNCMQCQISTPKTTREPLRMSPLPSAPWTELSADFGHLPNGQYILVVTDEYSRYPVVEILDAIPGRSVIPRLDKIFAEFGIPKTLKTDNGPPFNGHEFAQYCQHMGIHHRKTTPLWPRANAETERFMKTVKKTLRNTPTPQIKQQLYRFLLSYRSTPHCTTNIAPATILFGRPLRTMLPQITETSISIDHNSLRERDAYQKAKMKSYADNKSYVKQSDLKIGDPVLLKNHSHTKSDPPYQPQPLVVTQKKGSMVTAERGQQKVTRNSSFFKQSPRSPTEAEMEPDHPDMDTPDDTSSNTPESPKHHTSSRSRPTNSNNIPLRRSQRNVRFPKKFDDFITND